jgi:hypothetical protein
MEMPRWIRGWGWGRAFLRAGVDWYWGILGAGLRTRGELGVSERVCGCAEWGKQYVHLTQNWGNYGKLTIKLPFWSPEMPSPFPHHCYSIVPHVFAILN